MTSTASFHGATESELRSDDGSGRLARLARLADPSRLFAHHGSLRLESERLVLDGWRDIAKDEVGGVRRTFTDAYNRVEAGGTRGQFPSLGFLGHFGKPLIIDTRGDEDPVYLLLDYHRVLGSTSNKAWEARLRDWLSA